MKQLNTLNITTDVLGMPVLDPNTARLHGRVTDAIIHPTLGTLLCLLMEAPGGCERAVRGDDCHIFGEVSAVLAPGCHIHCLSKVAGDLSAGVSVHRELLGVQVVTEAGEQLGYVMEAHLHEERQQVFYRIAQSRFEEFPCSGFFISGSLPLRWVPEDAQLIVPTVTHLYSTDASRAPAWAEIVGGALKQRSPTARKRASATGAYGPAYRALSAATHRQLDVMSFPQIAVAFHSPSLWAAEVSRCVTVTGASPRSDRYSVVPRPGNSHAARGLPRSFNCNTFQIRRRRRNSATNEHE